MTCQAAVEFSLHWTDMLMMALIPTSSHSAPNCLSPGSISSSMAGGGVSVAVGVLVVVGVAVRVLVAVGVTEGVCVLVGVGVEVCV